MFKSLRLFSLKAGLMALLLVMAGCATFSSPFEKPEVKLVAIKLLPSDNFEQQLAIKLRVLNPNSVTLPLSGMKYSLGLQGYDLVSGVTNELAAIPAYAQADVELIATVDWINGLRLLQSVIARPESAVSYQLEAKLSPGRLMPAFRIVERGVIDLAPPE